MLSNEFMFANSLNTRSLDIRDNRVILGTTCPTTGAHTKDVADVAAERQLVCASL